MPNTKVEFVFIEKDAKRHESLEQEIAYLKAEIAFPLWISYKASLGEFSEEIPKLCNKFSCLPPTFAFIDPFGPSGVPLQTISGITGNPKCECLITFMFEYINRFISNTDTHKHLDKLFGTKEWREILNKKDSVDRRAFLLDLYRKQLIRKAGLSYIRTFAMMNVNNQPEYYLYFGTNSPKGLSKMKEAMWEADPIEGKMFSDRTDADQSVLFEKSADTRRLQKMLAKKFSGRQVDIIEVERYVLFDTPYCEKKHLRRGSLGPMETAPTKLIEVLRPSGRRQRAGEYPPGTKIRFR
jgi:three-Cys-motif partner protein